MVEVFSGYEVYYSDALNSQRTVSIKQGDQIDFPAEDITAIEGKSARLTLGFTYFKNHTISERQLDLWKTWPADVDIFLVDDGSETISCSTFTRKCFI